MFYYLSKILWFFLTPSNLIFASITLGFLLVLWRGERNRKRGLCLMGGGLVFLLLCGFGPVGSLLTIPLEKQFPAKSLNFSDSPIGIIVLGGAIKSRSPMSNFEMLQLNEAAERMTALIMLAKKYPTTKIIFTGGVGDLFDKGISEADEVRLTVGRLGVDPSRITFENRARNTIENAVFSKELAQPKLGERWLLVTSAWHMPRSMGCFRQAGFEVEAFPVDFRSNGWSDLRRPSSSISYGLRSTDIATREWLGLIAYKLAGKTSAFLPR